MPPPNTCSRCGADDAGAFCARCGAPVDDAVAALRQETYLTFVIEDVLASRDPVLALQRWQAQSAARRRLLSAGVPDAPAPAPAATAAPLVDDAVASEAAAEKTPVDTTADGATASTSSTTTAPRPGRRPEPAAPRPVSPPRPTSAARPQRPSRPTPQPLTPAEARARFEQRLEIGGWFTGALFAVGGSLWATNLFWDDIPATLRPAVVGAGLAAFAAAFMALGAVLAARHRDSLAGHVLGVVGRLIGVSATIPLALLRRENLPLALITDVVVMGSLWWAMRFAHRRSDTSPTGDVPPWSGARWFLVGFGLAVVGPTSPWLGIPVAIAALLVTRAAIADGTLPALAGQRTWVDDLSILAVGAAALTSSLLGIRDGMPGAVHGALWSVAIVAALDVVLRLIEQRQGLYVWRMAGRWLLALWSVGTAFNVVNNAVDTGPVLPAVALLFVAASFHDPSRLALPPLFRLVGVVATAMAAGFLTRFIPWSGSAADALFLTTTLLVILGLTQRERRQTNDNAHQVASLVLWLACSGTALAFADDGLVAVPALMVAAALWLTDRRAERSGAFNLLTVVAVMAPVIVVADDLLPRAWRSVVDVSVLCALGLGLAVARRIRPAWPLIAGATATSTWIVVVGIGASIAAADRESAFIVAIIIAGTLWALVELSRHVELGVAAAGILWMVVAIALRDPLGVNSLRTTMAMAALVLACLAFVPRMAGIKAPRLLLRAWSHGRARYARPWSLVAVGSVVVAALMVLRLPMMPAETGLLQAAASPALCLAALLFAVRHPSRRQWALFLASAICLGAEGGVATSLTLGGAAAVGPALAWMGLGAGVVAAMVAVAVVVVRMQDVRTVVTRRLWRTRRAPVIARDLWWNVAVVGCVVAFVTAIVGAAGADTAALAFLLVAAALALASLQGVVLFAGRAEQPLVAMATLAALTAPLSMAVRAFMAHDDTATLGFVLASIALAAGAMVLARRAYRRGEVPSILEAWPRPAVLRQPAFVVVSVLAVIVAGAGQGMHLDHSRELAEKYGPGLIIVGVALVAAALVALRTRRTFAVVVGALGVMGLVGGSIDGVAHAAQWLPTSFGTSEALVALGLVAVLLLVERDAGRRALMTVGVGWSLPVRRRLQQLLVVVVPVMAAFACLLAVREAPRAHELAIILAGAALIALVLVQPGPGTARAGAVGVVVASGGVGALMARVMFGAGIAFDTNALPVILLCGLVGCLLVQTISARWWALPALEVFHRRRLENAPSLLADVGRAMRRTVENQTLLLVAVVVAVTVVDPRPESTQLLSTWLALGLVVVLTSRMAVDREQTWPAALGQGMALAIYIDIRRRTPWLDDVGGIDAIACLVGAAVFIAIGYASRGQPRGASTARAAEMYAMTLPVIAAGFGSNDQSRALICLVGGGLYAVLSRTRRSPRYELACGVALVAATMLALSAQGVRDASMYLLPVAFVGTFLARRHRSMLGSAGRYLAVWCHVPLYCTSAWTALSTKTFGAFALGIVLVTIGVGYAIKVRDRRSLYAAASAAAVLVVGRLVLLGLDNALLGTLLLAGAGIGVLAAMTVFTIRRDAATDAVKSATRGLEDWDE